MDVVEGGLILPNSLHMVMVLYKQGKTLLGPQLVMDTMLVEKKKKNHFQAKSQEGNHSETFKHPQAELCI